MTLPRCDGPATTDVTGAILRNSTIPTEWGEGWASVGRSPALLAAGRIVAESLVSHWFPLRQVQVSSKRTTATCGNSRSSLRGR